jgi:hypothetical protein
MNKPTSLRAHLMAKVPELKDNPDRLQVFIDQGKVRCTAAATLSWEYAYTLQLILLDYAGHPDTVMLPLLAWVRVHQNELLANLDNAKEGLQFEADIIDKSKVDLSISLPLTERVVIGQDEAGNPTISHPAEPQAALAFLDPNWQAGAQGTGSEWYLPDE